MSNVVRRIFRPSLILRSVRGMASDKKDSSSSNAGSITAAGGKFAERESALENEYFHKLQKEQLKKLKDHLHEEIDHHESEIKRHKEAIERHKKKSKDLEKSEK